jgi:hypothetical protein
MSVTKRLILSIQVIKIFLELLFTPSSWDSSVGTVMGYGLDGLGSILSSTRFKIEYVICNNPVYTFTTVFSIMPSPKWET